ncbi:hypothetical protein ACVW1C_005049 [Bradyrhizobium sp. USDA 4011]
MAFSDEMTRCAEARTSYSKAYLAMAMNHCPVTRGKHVGPAHFRLMMAGAEMCRTAA